jgi:pyruvate kinase
MAMPRTKIVCTLGPASDDPNILRRMLGAGMDVARLNCSHGDHTSHARRLAVVRRLAREQERTLAVLCDLQGPKLRVGEIPGGTIDLPAGGQITLTTRSQPSGPGEIPLPHAGLATEISPGQRLLLDDGRLELRLEKKSRTELTCEVVTGGELRSHQGIQAPGARLSLPALTDKDRSDVIFALEQGPLDYIAQSFVRRAADVEDLRAFLTERGADVPIIAKIEKAEALEAFDEILEAADGIMVARGDLGIETPAEQVPLHQKRILRACHRQGKPSITATQMLQSMIDSPRPTRAEASDVANAVWDGTDAVMLSGETAVGHYPVEAVEVMRRIVTAADDEVDSAEWMRRVGEPSTPSEAIARATVDVAHGLGAVAIISSTISGTTARLVARYRPTMPVVAASPRRATCDRMALVWGVVPLLVPEYNTTDEMLSRTTQAVLESGLARPGERVVITAGIPAGGGGQTNMLKVHDL